MIGIPASRGGAGFTVLEVMVVVLIVGLVVALALPAYSHHVDNERRGALLSDANELYDAFIRYNLEQGFFPSSSSLSEHAFDRSTLIPLSNSGYYTGAAALREKLADNRIAAYLSPDVEGTDTQFWAVLTANFAPDLLILVASTSQYPAKEGTWFDGVYLIEGSEIVPAGPGR